MDKTKEMADKFGVTFPIAHSLEGEKTAAAIGAFFDQNRKFIQPTGFILRPDNTIEVACYSTGPVGRFVAADVLNLIIFYKSRKKA